MNGAAPDGQVLTAGADRPEVIGLAELAALLRLSDDRLVRLAPARLRRLCCSVDSVDDGRLWPARLATFVARCTAGQLKALQWAVESHYGELLRSCADDDLLDRYLTLAYNRVVSIRLRHREHMGHTHYDTSFVQLVLTSRFPSAPPATVRVLEVGCGTGELLADLAALGYRDLTGIDIAASALRAARDRLESPGGAPALLCATPQELLRAAGPARYDLVVHADVIEHIPPALARPFLAAIHRLLKPRGHMVVITPSALTGPHDDTREVAPPGTAPQGLHLREYTLADLVPLLAASGFVDIETVAVRPAANSHRGAISHENLARKVRLEPFLLRAPWPLRTAVVDGMYFRGLCCSADSSRAARDAVTGRGL